MLQFGQTRLLLQEMQTTIATYIICEVHHLEIRLTLSPKVIQIATMVYTLINMALITAQMFYHHT